MLLRLLLLTLFTGHTALSFATRIKGTVTDDKGHKLPYSSVFVKGTTLGVTANQEGHYALDLEPGEYTLVCQYVGYQREEKKLTVGSEAQVVDFRLSLQSLSMTEVVVRPGGEDPAYEIIRHAIKKRKEYQAPLDSFTCEAYSKTLIKTRGLPKKIFGQKVEEKDKQDMGVDSAGRGILYLSESLTKVGYKKPGKTRLEVLSSRVAGSNSYGFSMPTFINFYDNNVNMLSDGFSPRGFISPIAESALTFYRYKFLGSYFEDGKEINRIQVIPRRKYEPVFSGTIEIMEGDWRIHSVDLLLVHSSQLELLDTLVIRQIHVPVSPNIWQIKDQVVYFTFKILGIDAVGNFLYVYNKYDINPRFSKRYFGRVLMKYDTGASRKPVVYWDSIRPLPLEPDEVINYRTRDSIFARQRDSMGTKANRDSLLKRQGPVKVGQILMTGFSRSNYNPGWLLRYSMRPLLQSVQYNTVEGLNLTLQGTLTHPFKDRSGSLTFTPHIRYGFSNTHLNAWGSLAWSRRNISNAEGDMGSFRQTWMLSGGKRISQFNPANPIPEMVNSVYTILSGRNYMKIYENWFGELASVRKLDNGLELTGKVLYEARMPHMNTDSFTFNKDKRKYFTPNYPTEQLSANFARHQALISTLGLQYQPGRYFIQFPDHKASIGSTYPTMALTWQHGWDGLLSSSVNFDKWQYSIWQSVNFKLKGTLGYRLSLGGFFNTNNVPIQDYQHFNGNQTLFASQYLNSFQVAPYYANSTTASFYATGHIEHHFNGMLTNKIPLFRKLNWFLVGGSNAFYVNSNNNYVEVFGGLENIFKVLRVDFVGSYLNGKNGQFGVRFGLGGLLGNSIRLSQ